MQKTIIQHGKVDISQIHKSVTLFCVFKQILFSPKDMLSVNKGTSDIFNLYQLWIHFYKNISWPVLFFYCHLHN